MGRLGFEPRTNRLKAECSTAELATRPPGLTWWARRTYHPKGISTNRVLTEGAAGRLPKMEASPIQDHAFQ